MLIKRAILLSLFFHALAVCCMLLTAGNWERTGRARLAEFIVSGVFPDAVGTRKSLQDTGGSRAKVRGRAVSDNKGNEDTYMSEPVVLSPDGKDKEKGRPVLKEELSGPAMQPAPAYFSEIRGGKDTVSQGDPDHMPGFASAFVSGNAGRYLSPPGSVSANNGRDSLLLIKTAIEKSIIYPVMARKRRQEGTVFATFTINAKGQPYNIRVTKSSGFNILDATAKDTIVRAAPFPVISGTIEVPISFVLNED